MPVGYYYFLASYKQFSEDYNTYLIPFIWSVENISQASKLANFLGWLTVQLLITESKELIFVF